MRLTGTLKDWIQPYDYAVVSNSTVGPIGGECVERRADGSATVNVGGVLYSGPLIRFRPKGPDREPGEMG